MSNRVKWIFPKREDDYDVHIQINSEYTLCGLVYEGSTFDGKTDQGFVSTIKKATCRSCYRLFKNTQDIKASDFIRGIEG